MMSVVPEALPPTGGTSWAPVSLAGALPAPAHPAARIAAMPMPTQRDRFAIRRGVFIDYLPFCYEASLKELTVLVTYCASAKLAFRGNSVKSPRQGVRRAHR